MTPISNAVCIALLWTASAAAQTPLVEVTEAGISVHVQGANLGRLLADLDAAAGTESTVPPEFNGYSVNAWFDGLGVDQAVKRIFEGLPLDYAVIGQSRIIVTGVSEPVETRRVNPTVARSVPGARTQVPQNGISNPFQIPGQAVPGEAPGTPPQPFASPFGVPFNQVNPQAGTAGSPGQFQQQIPFGTPPGTQNAPPTFPGVGNTPPVFGNTNPLILDLNQGQPEPPSQTVPASPFPPPPQQP